MIEDESYEMEDIDDSGEEYNVDGIRNILVDPNDPYNTDEWLFEVKFAKEEEYDEVPLRNLVELRDENLIKNAELQMLMARLSIEGYPKQGCLVEALDKLKKLLKKEKQLLKKLMNRYKSKKYQNMIRKDF